MDVKEMLISIFEKEIGLLRNEREKKDADSNTYELEFVYKEIILLKILLIEKNHYNWFLYHELSKDDPILLKKIVYLCERIKRIKENKKTSFTLSDDLLDVEQESFLKTAVKCYIQNIFNKFTLFRDLKAKKINIQHENRFGKIKADL